MADSIRSMKMVAAAAAAGFFTFAALEMGVAQEPNQVRSLRGTLGMEAINPPPAEVKQTTLAKSRFARTFGQQPPLIPHQTEGYEISASSNTCLACHDRSVSTGAPHPTQAHYTDSEGRQLTKISGQRYFCTQCHVQQADAKPLVKNTFRNATQVK